MKDENMRRGFQVENLFLCGEVFMATPLSNPHMCGCLERLMPSARVNTLASVASCYLNVIVLKPPPMPSCRKSKIDLI